MSLGEGARGAREKGACRGNSTRVWREGRRRGEQAMEEAEEGVGGVRHDRTASQIRTKRHSSVPARGQEGR